ncbi:MAG: NUDIX domain-containing protein [bacterium]
MDVSEFKYCPYCAEKLSSNRCEDCGRTLYSSPHPNVSVLICDLAARQILLVKERKPDSPDELIWEIPGGFVELASSVSKAGESLEAALEREIGEELGQQNALTVIRNLSYVRSFGNTYRDGTPIVVVYFLATIRKADLSLSPKESVMARWFDINSLPSLDSPDREAIEFAKKRF